MCCQAKGYAHCGECDIMPCEKLYAYSYLDLEHGDKPQGARVAVCRKWSSEDGKQVWSNVLLTSAGFEDMDGRQRTNITNKFLEMLNRPIDNTKVLFIPTAAKSNEAIRLVGMCRDQLLRIGIPLENITTYDIDEELSFDEAAKYDVIYFTGGDTEYLLKRVKETKFDSIIKRMVYANKVYVGVSAGSLIATPNIGNPTDRKTAGLAIVNAYLSVHEPKDKSPVTDLPLPHIPLTDNQALAVNWNGYELIEN
jgi:Peptidase E